LNIAMFKLKGLGLTPATAVERLAANDPSLTVCDLRNNAVLQMKASELVPKLAAALAGNNTCQELNLGACGINDECATSLASALAQNTTLIHINLEENRIGNDGATAIAKALAQNRTLMQLNMLNQKGTRFGDATLHAFTDMFATNVTLLKIIWRLESRQSFRLTKMLTRNNDIDRRIKAGKDYADLLPSGAEPLSAALIAQRAGGAAFVGTPRASAEDSARSSANDSGGGGGTWRAGVSDTASRTGTAVVSDRQSGTDRSSVDADSPGAVDNVTTRGGKAGGGGFQITMPASTAAAPSASVPTMPPPPPPASLPDAELEEKLTALEVEYETALAALKADFAARKAALIEQHASSSEHANGSALPVS